MKYSIGFGFSILSSLKSAFMKCLYIKAFKDNNSNNNIYEMNRYKKINIKI